MEQSGVAAREWDFSGPTAYNPFANAPPYPPVPNPLDLFYWEYEKGDFSIRFDTEAGPFEQILLVAMLRAGADMADRATPRSGASLSGASLAGASLSGASLSGASLSGASSAGRACAGVKGIIACRLEPAAKSIKSQLALRFAYISDFSDGLLEPQFDCAASSR